MKALIAVSHLLGTGHLARGLALTRAFLAAGWEVKLASGGMPAPQLNTADVDLVQLPPVRSDGVNFSRLLDENGEVATEALFDARKDMLTDTLMQTPPDVLITELFPFGRRNLRHEFTALLEAAHGLPRRPLICASIRDILEPPSKPAKVTRADDLIQQFYDTVLVHGDAELTPLSASWPVSDALQAKLAYTGFVAAPPAPPHPDELGKGEIIVSAGGGAVGDHMFEAALKAAARSKDPWRLLIGGKNASERVAALRRNAPPNAVVEPARPEFRSMLHHAKASVSMGGYNTALDLLQSGCPAVIVPFDEGEEVEQTLRARALAKARGITVLPRAELTPETLHAAIQDVTATPRRDPVDQGLDGAARAVEIVTSLRRGTA